LECGGHRRFAFGFLFFFSQGGHRRFAFGFLFFFLFWEASELEKIRKKAKSKAAVTAALQSITCRP
jgi:hypothetical protein